MAAVWRSQCAFARVFSGKASQILNNSTDFGKILTPASQSITYSSKNYSSYSRSPFIEKIKEQYEFEIIKKPQEWQYVERLMPFDTIPDVKPKSSYPSGWIPPREGAQDLPFFLPRNKNHNLQIYIKVGEKGHGKRTALRNIEGDIWLLNDEIKAYLKEKNKRYVETRVHELARFIEVKGDHLVYLVDWAHSKGF